MIKKILFCIFISLISINSRAEIVNLVKEEENFGDWKIFCESDDMMEILDCKIGTKFFDQMSSITIEPNLKFFSQVYIVIPAIKDNSSLKIRVDSNDLILPQAINKNDFGLITLKMNEKQSLQKQFENGQFLFLRFNSKFDKEITAKINLVDFRKALDYYHNRALLQKKNTN